MELKKGIPLNQAFGAVLMLVLIGVLVIIGIFIFVNLGATFNTTAATTNNETGAWINQTGYTLSATANVSFNSPVITRVWNVTNGTGFGNYNNTIITAGNYTVSSAGVLSNITTTTFDDVSVTYSYLWGGQEGIATNTMIVQFGTYPVLVGLVGTIIFLGLVIGVLVASFAFGGRKGSGV